MTYYLFSFAAVLLFAFVHLFAEKIRQLDFSFHNKLVSFGSGVALAYVFLDILPKIAKNDTLVSIAFHDFFPYIERHVYLIALIGFLLFFLVERSKNFVITKDSFYWLSLSSYSLLNFLIGYAIVDKNNPEVQPLALFTLAIALHFFLNDFSLTKDHGNRYRNKGRWILIISLFSGWFIGIFFELSKTAIAVVSAFIGGGVIMNVTRNELSPENENNLKAFLTGTLIYTIILLIIGASK